MSQRFHLLILLVLSGFIFSCSNGAGPVRPADEPEDNPGSFNFTQSGPNTIILGAWEVFVDPANNAVNAVQLRSADLHVNVTPMITPPTCIDCFLVQNLSYNPVTQVVTVDVGFRNPSNITGFDVRGIITDFGNMEFLNPDGYTELFSPTPGEINPFAAYITGIGQREFPALSDQFETLEIYNPNFPGFASFTYVVEASWPENCREPYEVQYAGISGNLFSDGSNNQILQIIARDWQEDVLSVSVDLGPIGGGIETLLQYPTDPEFWIGPVSCAPGTQPGDYSILVQATSSPPTDQTADMYNYITLTVVLPPSPGAEVFGLPERVSNSDANSFIWPRHAIAVTDDGSSHVVWVDYSADGVQQHLFYSQRAGGVWTPPQQIDDGSGQAIYATIAADSYNNIHLVWEDSRNHVLGSDIFYASSSDGFTTESVLISGDDGYRNVHPKIINGDENLLHLAWHSREMISINEYEYDVWYDRRPAGSMIWDGAVPVADLIDVAEAWPAIAPGPFNSVFLAYQSDVTGGPGIYFTKNSSGTFTAPVTVTLNDSYQPSLDVASNDDLVLAYFNYYDGTYSDVFVKFSSDAGTTWGSATTVSESNDAFQYMPDIECTPEGDYHVAWHEEDETGLPDRVLYREYLNGSGWQDIIELVDSTGIGAFPSMDSDSDGHIHVVCQVFTPAVPPAVDNYEIWYRDSVP